MPEAVVVASARTPIGRAHKGSLTDVRADDLAAFAASSALEQVPGLDPSLIEDLYLGASNHTGEQSQNLARRVAVLLGRDDLPGVAVNRACASSIQTTRMAFHAIRAGEGEAFLSVGAESVSRFRTPPEGVEHPGFDEARARTARRAEGDDGPWSDPREHGALPDYYIPMGHTAENVAEHSGVSREDQDAFALRSQQQYAAAEESGFNARVITPLTLPDGTVVDRDDSPRPQTTLEKLGQLQPVFRPGGTVTAGNSCPLNDGAAALVVVSDRVAATLDAPLKARVLGTAATGISPEIMGLGPVEATAKVLQRCGLQAADLDVIEINEAFAAQVIASQRALKLDEDKVNVNGGAIALGHPFGMTGARLIGQAMHLLQERDEELALVTLCVGMGQGMALVLQRVA
ncbi:acetyl-CoA C-acyltransferase [Aeromicrobium choanae]|uniref:acetyl-CoA C-acyltransferase n=1 Tax=Aeromicrobium choanae TaxID=1736691 RepID=A0A1T4YWM6_9ACTN|nr:acetyl-CoA C-acyltransferase [Aeromicrobium choanae]SKB06136.1 acetyl-CoA C-acetyltransferase [Aeromicrobium choanae]